MNRLSLNDSIYPQGGINYLIISCVTDMFLTSNSYMSHKNSVGAIFSYLFQYLFIKENMCSLKNN